MKKICSDPDVDVCRALKNTLEAQGIPCVLKNEISEPALGGSETPLLGSLHPELWILHDSQFDRALQIVHPGDDPPPATDDMDAGESQ